MKPGLCFLALATTLVLSLLAYFVDAQGPLSPLGPPAPTMKTLDQVEPRIPLKLGARGVSSSATATLVIDDAGSYYLTGNFDVKVDNGIVVEAPNVTIDLMGYSIRRSDGTTGGSAIEVSETSHRCTIKNGNIGDSINPFAYGIECLSESCSIKQISATGCTNTGIVTSDFATLKECVARNGGNGIGAGNAASLTNCSAIANTRRYGIECGANSSLNYCVALDNETRREFSIDDAAIGAGDSSNLEFCFARGNISKTSIKSGSNSLLTACIATENSGTTGIFADRKSTLLNCSAILNTVYAGISAHNDSHLYQCSARNNWSDVPFSRGIFAGENSIIKNCAATRNSSTASEASSHNGTGMFLWNGCEIIDCIAISNQGNGIRLGSHSILRNCNIAFSREGAGIYTSSANSRIEGNHVSHSNRGIEIESLSDTPKRNMIVGNTAIENETNYVIAAGNLYGPIIDRSVTVASSPAVSGNSAASTLETKDPWANFAY